jgi:hypothetical protein
VGSGGKHVRNPTRQQNGTCIKAGSEHGFRFLSILVYLPSIFAQQYVVGSWAFVIPHPFRLDPEEDPHPPSDHLQKLHKEYAAFQIIEVVQVWRELETPGTPQQKIDQYRGIVQLLRVEIAMPPQAPGVFGVVSLSAGREERQIPVLGHVPVKGVK